MNPLATSTATSPLEWTSQGAFASLGPTFFTALEPTPLPQPHWIGTSTDVAQLLALDADWMASDEALHAFTGNARLPGSSLFNINPARQGYLIETDPAFTDYRQWLSSDYMLKALNVDPEYTHKRLGDGYYEQKLVKQVSTKVVINLLLTCGITILLLIKILESTI